MNAPESPSEKPVDAISHRTGPQSYYPSVLTSNWNPQIIPQANSSISDQQNLTHYPHFNPSSASNTHYGYQNLAIGTHQSWYQPYSSYQVAHHYLPWQWPDIHHTSPRAPSLLHSLPSDDPSFEEITRFLQQDCIDPILDSLARMADPLSITASIVSVASAGIKLTAALYTLVDSIRTANSEIELLTIEITVFSCTLDEVQACIERSSTLYSDNLISSLKKLLEACTRLYSDIEKILKTSSGGGSYLSLRNLMWALRREKIRPIRLSLESLKTTLMVMLQTMKLVKVKRKIHKK